ncbi:MAG: hypothetical protein MUC73_03220 [Cyclobacteriaceae bacterium]|jgi:hypothetical protein|nr:hypothetical protein [Cyclobacteriaceae bacterium]
MSRSASSVLLIILIVLTFPFWIGIAGGIFGLVAGLFGAAIGVMAGIFGAIAGVFGAIFGIIGKLFGWLFGGLFNFHVFPHIHFPGPVTFLLIILVIALIVRSNKTPSKK